MERLSRFVAQRWVLWTALLFSVLALVAFARFDGARPIGTPGVVALQLAFSAEAFRRILALWGAAGAEAYWRATLLADSWFPIAYSVLLSSVTTRLLVRSSLGSAERWRSAIALPFAAAILDWVENTLHLMLLRSVLSPALSASEGLYQADQSGSLLVAMASTAAVIKWGLLAVSLVAILLMTVRVIRLRLMQRGS
jgi:hypothetical protein